MFCSPGMNGFASSTGVIAEQDRATDVLSFPDGDELPSGVGCCWARSSFRSTPPDGRLKSLGHGEVREISRSWCFMECSIFSDMIMREIEEK